MNLTAMSLVASICLVMFWTALSPINISRLGNRHLHVCNQKADIWWCNIIIPSIYPLSQMWHFNTQRKPTENISDCFLVTFVHSPIMLCLPQQNAFTTFRYHSSVQQTHLCRPHLHRPHVCRPHVHRPHICRPHVHRPHVCRHLFQQLFLLIIYLHHSLVRWLPCLPCDSKT